jgi:hypothetical protein
VLVKKHIELLNYNFNEQIFNVKNTHLFVFPFVAELAKFVGQEITNDLQ